jgi:hypothetical protein
MPHSLFSLCFSLSFSFYFSAGLQSERAPVGRLWLEMGRRPVDLKCISPSDFTFVSSRRGRCLCVVCVPVSTNTSCATTGALSHNFRACVPSVSCAPVSLLGSTEGLRLKDNNARSTRILRPAQQVRELHLHLSCH